MNALKNPISFILLLMVLIWSCNQETTATRGLLTDDGTFQYHKAGQKPFYHGVASGDPLADRVILWTRVTPEALQDVEVSWNIATDEAMQNVVNSGTFTTNENRDFTVKVDADGLQPDTYYYYQFAALDGKSPVGRTKTAPTGDTDELAFAVVSCSNFEAGFFNAFGRIAEQDDLDAVLHLGDYIYEYGIGVYGDTTLGRLNVPPHEIVKLSDYRTRYALYRLDEDFQAAHQMHPFITIWDDHEITNNSYQTGAQNHQPDEEGDYEVRKAAAKQAYYEWLPVRETEELQLYRHIAYGNLVDLIMLDERLAGRSQQVDSLTAPNYEDPERTMLGTEQLAWFQQQLADSDATWKVIGNQVIFSELDFSAVFPGFFRNLDAWDGYPIEKQKIINFIQENEIKNVIFVTGDSHASWAFEVPTTLADYKADSTSVVAVEFGGTSVSSPNYDERATMDTVLMVQELYKKSNPQLKFTNLHDHGYFLLRLKPEEAVAEYRYVGTLKAKDKTETIGKTLRVKSGTNELMH